MPNNTQSYFEKNTPPNEVAGVAQALLFATHNAIIGADRALWPVVGPEMRRIAEAQRATEVYASQPVDPTPEAVQSPIRPTATEMLAQVATAQHEQLTTVKDETILANDQANPELMADDLRKYINTLYEGERRAA